MRGQRPEEPRAAARWRKGAAAGSEGEEKPTTTPRAPLTRPEAQSRFYDGGGRKGVGRAMQWMQFIQMTKREIEGRERGGITHTTGTENADGQSEQQHPPDHQYVSCNLL